MTWYEALSKHKVVNSIFRQLPGDGSQNDRMLEFLRKYTRDHGAINDLYYRQKPITREMLIHVLKARIIRRLS